MRIDWQAYLDGSLSPEDQARADKELRENPAAQRELDGLKSFVSTIREACLCERVPLDTLARLMPETRASRPRLTLLRPQWVAGLAAAAVLAFAFFRFGPSVAATDDITTTNPVAAANWASARMKMSVPALDLGTEFPLFYAHGHEDRCCLDYKVDGRAYHVNFSRKGEAKDDGREVNLSTGLPAKVGRGVRWTQGEFELFVVGPDVDVSLEIANRASAKLLRT